MLLLLLLFLLVGSLPLPAEPQPQPQPQAELSRDGILCIAQSREETALKRWLHCMLPSSSQDLQDHELSTMDIDSEKKSQIELFTMGKEDLHEKSAVDDEIPQVEQRVLNQGDLSTGGELAGNGVQDEGGRIGASAPLAMRSEDANKPSSSHSETQELRSVGDDALLHWLKLNLGMLAFGKLLFSFIGRRIWKKGKKKLSEPDDVICLAEDNGMEADPEISKGVTVNNVSSKKSFETSHLHVIGSSLGSAVGAVFSEVLLKMSNSGCPIPSEKITVLLEGALKELSILVEDDDGCSRLVADFITAFKNTYATMYRIQQACTLYEVSRERNLCSQRHDSFSTATCEKQCTSAISNDERMYASGADLLDDSWQVKQCVPLDSSGNKGKNKNLESRSVLAVDAVSEQNKSLVPLADCGEFDSDNLGTSCVETHDCVPAVGFRIVEKSEMNCGRQESLTFAGNNDGFKHSANFMDEGVTQFNYEVDDASSLCEEPPGVMPRLDALALMVQHQATDGSEFQKDFLKIYERDVRAQEQHNQIKFVKLRHSIKQQILEEEKIQLTIAANGLMRENIDLDRSKANFKESRILEQQAKGAYVSFSSTCADELAAGLLVMLATLVYSVRKYSFALLNDLVSTCQSPTKEPRRSWGIHIDWFYNSLDSLAGKLQAFVCHVTVTGRISFGLVLVAVVASSLLRRSVTNSSQAMPATILIIVLGGVCGFIGKLSVDSLGGSGNQWWVVWGAFCLLHALTNCFTPSVCRLLHGSPSGLKARFGLPFWIRRLAFHITLVLVLPVLAGLLPFGSFCLVMNDLFQTLAQILSSSFSSFYEWSTQIG